MSNYIQSNQAVKLIAAGAIATYSVSLTDNGKIILIPALGAAHALTIYLPAVAAGLKYKFVASDTLASAATITPSNGANPPVAVNALVNGTFVNTNGNGAAAVMVPKTTANTAVLNATAVSGDFIEAYSDGVNWYVSGVSQVAAGLA